MYHSVATTIDDPRIQVTPQTLDRQLGVVTDLGYRWASLTDALARKTEPLAAVTFDDGYEDFLSAVPALEDHGAPVTLFICPALLGSYNTWCSMPEFRSRLLDVQQIKSLDSRPLISMGCHGWTHRSFTDLPIAVLEEQLLACLDWFRANLPMRPEALAYPFGCYSRDVAQLVSRYFNIAVAVDDLDRTVALEMRVPRAACLEGVDRAWLEAQLGRFDLGRGQHG